MTDEVEINSFNQAIESAKEAGGKRHILLGNGFSIGAYDKFDYVSLYKRAKESGLSEHVKALFDRYGTTDFEQVLNHLREGQWLAEHYRLAKTDCKLDMNDDYGRIKEALLTAITTTHPANRGAVREDKLQACAGFLEQFHNVFTTNYDLLLYWAVLANMQETKHDIFKDGFGKRDGDSTYLVFDSVPQDPNITCKYMYFLHGALHLYTDDGDVRKVKWGGAENPSLINQIREKLAENRFPLVVSEGDPEQKKVRIGSNGYLTACRNNFQKIKGSLFVFGSSLGHEDTHILRWIAQNQNLKLVFLGIHSDSDPAKNKAMISRIRNQVDKALFYDSTTANVWTVPAKKTKGVKP